jgi:polyisoprenoid-binding protein YceI
MIKKAAGIIAVGMIALAGFTGYTFLAEPEAASGAIEAIPVQTQAAADASTLAPALAVYQISQSGTRASFSIEEVLRGSPKSVMGTTEQVAGEVSIDPAHPSTATVGTIQINARGISVPSVPFVASVGDQVGLTLDFAASR